ncbi:MAG: gfo/Idh/MocA family oxidoreductase [Bacteroidetes bacterium]|nr:MAG: gfo/Idh/MocA family oxidoreductase [Bacteroidota bacterium]
MNHSRRSFLKQSGLAVAAAGVPYSLTAQSPVAPSDQVQVALIGCRNQGFSNLKDHLRQPGVVCGGLCDVDQQILEERAAEVERLTGTRPPLYGDYRKLLENKDIDAVIIGTPDHWHALMLVDACAAGKAVYVEKPLANSIAECDLMVKAARYYKRVVQVGQQQRSGLHWQAVVDYVQSGLLGGIRRVQVWANFNYGKGGERVPATSPPAHLDFDRWLGPAPAQPYHATRVHGSWRHQWDFGGGLMTDWGVHLLDIVLWAMQVEGAPRSVRASGGIYAYPDRAIETPDTLDVQYDMGGWTLSWEQLGGVQRGIYGRNYGIAFIGANGTLVVNRSGWEVIPQAEDGRYLIPALPPQRGQESNHERHAINFLAAIRDQKDPICTVEMGREAAFYAHLGNIAQRTDSVLRWDATKGQFLQNKAANALLKPDYRAPWRWPSFG